MDWFGVLDLPTALANVAADVLGDWYHDPWGWPEARWMVEAETGRAILAKEFDRSRPYQSALIDVPKENYGTRPAVVMNPTDRLIYQACVDRLSNALIGRLHGSAFGWRLDRGDPTGGKYCKNRSEYTDFRRRLSALARAGRAVLLTDVTGCFANIGIPRASENLEHMCGKGKIGSKIIELMAGFDAIPGRRGLAQRSLASCVIANGYLATLDGLLARASSDKHARWMDDIYVFGGSWSALRRIQLMVLDTMRDLGLEMNVSKTRILEDDAMRGFIDEVDASGVAYALLTEEDAAPLLERVEEEIVAPAEGCERTTISHACALAMKFDVVPVAEALAEVAERLPHGADHLAELFTHFDMGRNLCDWFLEYEASDWGQQHWAVAHLAKMLPSDLREPGRALDRFSEMLCETHHRAQVPVLRAAGLRVCSWAPNHAVDILRSGLQRASHPHEVRLLALLALTAGEERARVRGWLAQHEDNRATLAWVEDRSYRMPSISKLRA